MQNQSEPGHKPLLFTKNRKDPGYSFNRQNGGVTVYWSEGAIKVMTRKVIGIFFSIYIHIKQ
jgi:hypothetical protein